MPKRMLYPGHLFWAVPAVRRDVTFLQLLHLPQWLQLRIRWLPEWVLYVIFYRIMSEWIPVVPEFLYLFAERLAVRRQ